ncbi:MAG: lysophospholipid acyltransferase family protein [Paracoccaceae bacterium]
MSEAAPAVVARRDPRLCRFFVWVMRRQMRGAFRAVRLAREQRPDASMRPLVIYTNHPAWWDPAFFMVLQGALFPDREGYGPIEAEQLARYPFMRRIGLFGVPKGDRAAARPFLETARGVLAAGHRMLWITAEGEFTDPRVRPVRLRRGLAHLMAARPDAVAVPLALEYPFWTEARPEALARFGPAVEPADRASAAAWQTALETGLETTLDALAADAIARRADAFETLVSDRGGVGGIWGAIEAARARLAGKRFEPEHMAE